MLWCGPMVTQALGQLLNDTRWKDVDLLGSLLLDIRIREQADSGNPTVTVMEDGQISGIYRVIAVPDQVRHDGP